MMAFVKDQKSIDRRGRIVLGKKQYVITEEDAKMGWILGFNVSFDCCEHCGRTGDIEFIPVKDTMGKILPGDVGKIMQKSGEVWQVENDAQMAARLKRNRKVSI